MKMMSGAVDAIARVYYFEERGALKKAGRSYVEGGLEEQRGAAFQIKNVIEETCAPGGFKEGRRVGRILAQMMRADGFRPVFARAQELFLTSSEGGNAFHEKVNGQIVLQAAGKYGFGAEAISWPKIIANILSHVENEHVERNADFIQDRRYRDLLRDLVSEQPQKTGVTELYAQTAGQIAARVCELSCATPQAPSRTPPAEIVIPKVKRMLMLLVDGVERQRVLDLEKGRDLASETVDDMALGLALKRLPHRNCWLMALGRS